MTSLQSQYLLCPPLACNTSRTHQQPMIATSGYFTWETEPWQQEKQHQMSQVSDEYRHRQSETVSVKTACTRQTSFLWRSTETSVSTCKGSMVQQSKELGPAKLEASLIQRWIKIHAAEKRWPYTCLQTPEWEVRRNCVLEVDNFGGGSVMMWSAISYADKHNWCTSTTTLPLLDTEMRFWHHTCCPQWASVGKFFSTTMLGCTQFVLLLTF
jgi:hypothetical protein